jgi:hypothetical protein
LPSLPGNIRWASNWTIFKGEFMSKKHYEAIAKIINDNLWELRNSNNFLDFVQELCSYFAEENERFNSDKFRFKCFDESNKILK